MNITVMASGGGGNFKYLVGSSVANQFEVVMLLTDRPCGAELIASSLGIEFKRLNRDRLGQIDSSETIQAVPNNTDLIVLAGFMPIVPAEVINKWNGKVINTHPSLLPKHGGIGMYGVKVHESVLAAGDTVTGCTVHFVTDEVDMGPVIHQTRVPVPRGISAWDLGGIVYSHEGPQLVKAIQMIKDGERL